MRGEICVGSASILAFASLLLLIFVHVGQINTSTIPRRLAMVQVNMSGYGDALELSINNPIFGLYTSNSSAPLGQGLGLRQNYYFGLYAHCGYVNETAGICGNHTIGEQFRPFIAVTSDMNQNNYSLISQSFILDNTTFTDSKYTGQSSKAAYWMILLGTVCAALALTTGIAKNNYTFCASTIFSIAGSLLLLIGASIWTVLIKKTEAINTLLAQSPGKTIPLGITVSVGPGLLLLWAAFACLSVSIVPYMISCCTWRG